MKKVYSLIILILFFGLHLSALDIFAQSCSQLGLPENALARLCRSDGGRALDLDFSPDGKTLASIIHWPPKVVLWDIENKHEKITIHDVTGESVRYSPDGKVLVCGDVIYDAQTGEPQLILFGGDGYRKFVAYSPDGKTIAGVGRKGIRFWPSTPEPLTAPKPTNILPTDILPANTSKASPVSKPIATSSQTVPDILGLSYSPDGKEVAIACALGIWIYDPALNQEIALLTHEEEGHKDSVTSVVFSPDGKTLASSGNYSGDNTIRLWDAETKKLKFTFFETKISKSFYYLNSLAFSSDSKILISTDGSGNNQVHLWDTINGEYKYTLPGHNGGAGSSIFSPDGQTIASAGGDQTILLWDFTSYPIMSLSPDSVTSPIAGEELTFNLRITNAKNLSGYQATIDFDPETLMYLETEYSNHLSQELPVQPVIDNHSGRVTLAAISASGVGSKKDGRLARLTFKVNTISSSKLTLGEVILSDNEGNSFYAWIQGAKINKTATEGDACPVFNIKDINKDCLVNIQDLVLVASNFGSWERDSRADVNGDGRVNIIDLVLVAGAFSHAQGAPAAATQMPEIFSAFSVRQWLREARHVNLADATFQRGILMLEELLTVLSPEETRLFANYPNPFNPETWIPYQLAASADVRLTIYAMDGRAVRTLALGHQPIGMYQDRSRAAYWDGRNSIGEPVASGVYFYTLTAGDFTATRKMLILK